MLDVVEGRCEPADPAAPATSSGRKRGRCACVDEQPPRRCSTGREQGPDEEQILRPESRGKRRSHGAAEDEAAHPAGPDHGEESLCLPRVGDQAGETPNCQKLNELGDGVDKPQPGVHPLSAGLDREAANERHGSDPGENEQKRPSTADPGEEGTDREGRCEHRDPHEQVQDREPIDPVPSEEESVDGALRDHDPRGGKKRDRHREAHGCSLARMQPEERRRAPADRRLHARQLSVMHGAEKRDALYYE
jgi:hypothetical protein